ncbi:hypothetical protein [Clostridium estertheticum]|uniref:hypothetical protein n=1 Tax=Clostridium estertheticum TaxID=238834 RepID=UPI001C0E5A8B|nr:hypothetical protein [Clostridium estertheticum]MBU3072721.1 hypothetical protein [Clostridium estertheticum]MBU3162814.1 hypothetical protein [Clostridium estertheticum]
MQKSIDDFSIEYDNYKNLMVGEEPKYMVSVRANLRLDKLDTIVENHIEWLRGLFTALNIRPSDNNIAKEIPVIKYKQTKRQLKILRQ